jgi:hypothetical protein
LVRQQFGCLNDWNVADTVSSRVEIDGQQPLQSRLSRQSRVLCAKGQQLRSDAATSRRSAIDDGDMRSDLRTAKDRFKVQQSGRKPSNASGSA